MHVPGNGLLSGWQTWAEFLAKLGPAMQAVAGSFREEVLWVVVDDDNVCVLAAQQAKRDGRLHRWHAVHLWRIEDGKLAEFSELVDDFATFEAAWRC
jgi:ketosteroid isomerase-like protein